jgi:uncharacterized protein with gpF-like domain
MQEAKVQTIRFNQQQYRRDWIRSHHSYEQTQYRNFKSALDEQVKMVIYYIKQNGIYDLKSKLSVLVSPQPMAIAYKKCYTEVGVKQAAWVYNWIDKAATGKKSFEFELKEHPSSFFSEYWRKLMSLFYETDGGTRITSVTETTRDTIIRALDEAEDQQLTTSQQADYMVAKVGDKDFNRDRALRIARTESTTAANKGAFYGAESSDYQTGKIWIPVMDANTRPDHAAMDGMPAIDLYDSFEVGSSLMQYPGDMSAPANEVVNCRCVIAMVPLVNENGLPLLKRLVAA